MNGMMDNIILYENNIIFELNTSKTTQKIIDKSVDIYQYLNKSTYLHCPYRLVIRYQITFI